MKITSKINIETKNQDLGLTVLSWLAEDLSDKDLNLTITDAHSSSTLIQIRKKSDKEIVLACSPEILFFKKDPLRESLRKIWVRMVKANDFTSIDQLQLIRRQQNVRQQFLEARGDKKEKQECRFLLRVDDYPSPFVEDPEVFLKFHKIARDYRIPYLLAVTPFLDIEGYPRQQKGITEREFDILNQCREEGAAYALHGFMHERRDSRISSELVGMPEGELREKLKRADSYLKERGIDMRGFVAPFNSYDASTLKVLLDRFDFICGGPESTEAVGYRMPSFFQRKLYLPSYRGAYDITEKNIGDLDKLIEEAKGLTVPITLHWANEYEDDFRSFRMLCERLTNHTLSWDVYLDEIFQLRDKERANHAA